MGSDVASRVGWQCFNIRRKGAPGVVGLVPGLAATPAKTVLGEAGRRGPGNNRPVRRRATGDRRSDPVRTAWCARPKAYGDRSTARSSRCDRAASRRVLAGRPRGRETGTAQDPRAAVVEGCLRCGGGGRSKRTREGWCALSAAPTVARAFSGAWDDLRDAKHATRRGRDAICLFGPKVSPFLTHQEQIASFQDYGFQASLELEKHAQPDARRAGEEQPLKEIRSTEVKDNCYARLAREEEPCPPFLQSPYNHLYEGTFATGSAPAKPS